MQFLINSMLEEAKNSILIANYLLLNCKTLTPLELNKLVFFSHGWHLGIFGKPLTTETVEAWKYGPVIPSIYHLFKFHPRQPISSDELGKIDENLFNDDQKNVMDQVIKTYGKMEGGQLIEITHEKGSPWDQTFNPQKPYIPIPNKIIEKYYAKKYANL